MDRLVQSPGDGLMLASPAHVYKSATGTLTDMLAGEIGQRYAIITGNKGTLQGKESIIRAGGCETGRYTKTNQDGNGTYSDDMYSHNYQTGKVRHDATWNVNCMEPSSLKWRNTHLQQLRAIAAEGTVDDIFSDSAGRFAFDQAGNHAGKPSTWKTPYTLGEFLNKIHQNLDAWQLALPSMRFLVNGLSKDTINLYTPTVGMIENAFGSNKGTLPVAADWLATCNLLIQAQVKGWNPWVYIKLRNYGTDADKWRKLIIPTLMLISDGYVLVEIGPAEGGPPPWVSGEYMHSCYHPNIGLPLTSAMTEGMNGMANGDGVFDRPFKDGFVAVNPTASPIDYQADKSDPASQFTIPAQEGIIVQRQTTTSWKLV